MDPADEPDLEYDGNGPCQVTCTVGTWEMCHPLVEENEA